MDQYNGFMGQYEIEIKSLLGEEDRANRLIDRLHELDQKTSLKEESSQLNHYFEGGDVCDLYENVHALFDSGEKKRLKEIVDEGHNFSVRTREINGEVRLVLKASIGDDSSENGVSRIEFEENVDISLEDLDQKVLDSGYQYQAKWSRHRREFLCKGNNVCVDRNAGYGYLAEFERIVHDASVAHEIERELRNFMKLVECEELSQERLGRMFDFYNRNWPDYYGTEKVFVIE